MDLNERVGASTVAEALDLGKSQVNNLVADGVLHPEGSPRRYVFKTALHDYIAYLRKHIDPSKDDERSINKKKLKADAVYKTARAQTAQLELAELEGSMHRAEDVKDAFEQFGYGVRSMLLALPGRVAIDVAPEMSAAEASEIIRAEVFEILDAMSQFDYDPAFFEERVRDRKGWLGIVDAVTGEGGAKPPQGPAKRGKDAGSAGKPHVKRVGR